MFSISRYCDPMHRPGERDWMYFNLDLFMYCISLKNPAEYVKRFLIFRLNAIVRNWVGNIWSNQYQVISFIFWNVLLHACYRLHLRYRSSSSSGWKCQKNHLTWGLPSGEMKLSISGFMALNCIFIGYLFELKFCYMWPIETIKISLQINCTNRSERYWS